MAGTTNSASRATPLTNSWRPRQSKLRRWAYEQSSGTLLASSRRRPHAVRSLSARLPPARRAARRVLRAPTDRRRDGAHHVWALVGVLHRSDREEAAQPFL